MSSYFETLDRQGKDRYRGKLEAVGLSLKDDPYTPGASDKWRSDMACWPKIRGGATGSKGHELILLQGAILSQTMVLSRARHDF